MTPKETDPRYIPSIAELKPQPWGGNVTVLPGGAYVLQITEVEEKIRQAYLAELTRVRTQLEIAEMELELIQKQRDLAVTAQAVAETKLRLWTANAQTSQNYATEGQ